MRSIIDIVENLKKVTPYWSMISSLLHLVGLRPRVYYILLDEYSNIHVSGYL